MLGYITWVTRLFFCAKTGWTSSTTILLPRSNSTWTFLFPDWKKSFENAVMGLWNGRAEVSFNHEVKGEFQPKRFKKSFNNGNIGETNLFMQMLMTVRPVEWNDVNNYQYIKTNNTFRYYDVKFHIWWSYNVAIRVILF